MRLQDRDVAKDRIDMAPDQIGEVDRIVAVQAGDRTGEPGRVVELKRSRTARCKTELPVLPKNWRWVLYLCTSMQVIRENSCSFVR